jgi:hypothetical protein
VLRGSVGGRLRVRQGRDHRRRGLGLLGLQVKRVAPPSCLGSAKGRQMVSVADGWRSGGQSDLDRRILLTRKIDKEVL